MKKIDPKYSKKNVLEFIQHSNYIEREFRPIAVRDALRAWDYLSKKEAISKEEWIPTILEVHRLLLKRVRPDIAGQLRKLDVMVGGRLCPGWERVPELLARWVEVYSDPETDEETLTSHVEFETIHPFEDGNGRVGRLILNWQRMKVGLPLFVVHLGLEQYHYYESFRLISSE